MVDSNNVIHRPDDAPRRQQRGVLTRQKLLRSACEIFARDGFEHARVEDIAANAGRTRGAFYDNFKDKEDVFFAVFEEDLYQNLAEIGNLFLGLHGVEERIEALSEYLSTLSRDRERTLLNLEFKMYAIRHPAKRKRLNDLHNLMRLRCCIPLVSGAGQSAPEQLTESLALGGVVEGLMLNHLFDPEVLDAKELKRYLSLFLQQYVSSATS